MKDGQTGCGTSEIQGHPTVRIERAEPLDPTSLCPIRDAWIEGST